MMCEDQCRFHGPAATSKLALGLCLVPLGKVVSMAEARGPTPCVLPPVFFLPPPHPIPISVLCGLTELTCIWGGSLSPGQSGTEERGLKHYWFTSWPDQKTPDRAPPPPPAPGAGGGGGCPAGGAALRPHHRPLQRRDWEDWLLHCHQHLLPAAAAGGCGGHPEDHVPAPAGQGRHDPDVRAVPVCASCHEPV
uniref:Protein tyrosine phosphatase non-receptor type 5 n=1 Tax=Myotis myotis TaxID=51298 RepID=A0A7J7VJX5_MYOMY|nr:protein tyrosine phosphatase non-receptor type 5 [Myotis myotis]